MTVDEQTRAATVALVSLPGIGPARLSALVAAAGGADEAWALVRGGGLDHVDLRSSGDRRRALVDGWRHQARGCEPARVLDQHRAAGIGVLLPGDARWPAALLDDPEPPAALFVRGDPRALDRRRAGVVGTRRATALGMRVATDLGSGLAAAEVAVVSGLALGIDGAAHRGCLDAGGVPVGVVATGVDVVYPARHRGLWHDVVEAGVLFSEWPMGTRPDRWRFPARNRLVAALSEVVVVVESDVRGGSMSTVEAAIDRQRDVMAVPGPVVAARSAGTNRLLHEGAGVARDATDVVVAMGLPGVPRTDDGNGAGGPPDPVLDALSTEPVSLDVLAARTGVDVATLALTLARHEAAGRVVHRPGGYAVALP